VAELPLLELRCDPAWCASNPAAAADFLEIDRTIGLRYQPLRSMRCWAANLVRGTGGHRPCPQPKRGSFVLLAGAVVGCNRRQQPPTPSA
jgi:hypothetical protein